jgi:hypothetical protein
LYRHNTINAYQITEKHLVGEVYETVANYDLMSAIMICLGTKEDERYTGLLKLLDIWLSRNSIDEKRAALLHTASLLALARVTTRAYSLLAAVWATHVVARKPLRRPLSAIRVYII